MSKKVICTCDICGTEYGEEVLFQRLSFSNIELDVCFICVREFFYKKLNDFIETEINKHHQGYKNEQRNQDYM